MKVEIDRDGCIGCGLCASISPELFRMDEDGKAEVYAQPTPDQEEGAEEAAESCPVSVITAE